MASYKCKMCGASLEAIEGQSVVTCSYCGSKQTVANSDDDRKEGLFNRANSLRIACEFDKAFAAYQSIISLFPNEAEAHWGLCLCRYGIEYVDDPVSHKKVPTVHRASYESILKDSDYLATLSLADVVAREQYELEANEIASIQKNFLQISQKEDPFDIFICYKESDENGKRTPDSVMAQEIYDELTNKGYKVFFARVTLESKLGSMYEPYIFTALNSAKIMLAIGTKKEYFEATWVKNEWSRYLDLMRDRPDRYLIPCYKGMDAYEMPEGFLSFQAQNLAKLGFMQDLLRGIDKIMGKEAPKPRNEEKGYASSPNVNIRALLKRAEILIGDGENGKADALLETVLNNDPENSDAYLLKSVIALKVPAVDGLKTLATSPESEPNFKKAYKYGDEKQKARLDGILNSIEDRKRLTAYENAITCKDNGFYDKATGLFTSLGDYKDSKEQIEEISRLRKKHAYNRALTLKNQGCYDAAKPQFASLGDFEDSAFQAEECARLKKEAVDEETYQKAISFVKDKTVSSETLSAFRYAITQFSHIQGYKDADELSARYEGAIKEWEAEQEKEKEELARKKAIHRKRAKKVALISSISAVCVTAILLATFLYFVPEGRQNSIIGSLNSKNYDAALSQINANGDYGDNGNLRSMCYAGQAFEKNDYEEGIDYVLSAGGNVDVAYDGNGGTCKNNENIKAAKRINNDPKKEGYTFSGWAIDSYSIDAGSHYASLNLKATYDLNAYKITYVLNGGANDSANPSSYTIETSDITLLPATRSGYTFAGWSDGSSTVSTIKKGSCGDLTLTAQWSAISYSITYDLDGGSIDGQKNSYTIEESAALPNPTRTGYDFLGWTGSNGVVPEKDVSIPKGSVGDKTYEAHWEAIRYSITYVLNGGVNDSANPSSYTIETSDITLLPATRSGYTFAGWSDGSSTVSTIKTGSYRNLTLTAQWSVISYRISYDLQKGSMDGQKTSYTVEEAVNLPNPTRAGYAFLGWIGSNGMTPEIGYTQPKGSVGDKSYQAKWRPITYDISYVPNGGANNSANPSSYTIESSDITLLPATRSGYTFAGWSDGSSTVSAIKTGSYGNLTLTAQWSANEQTLNVSSSDSSKGSVSVSGIGYTDEKITVTATPANDCLFKGWYNGENLVSKGSSYAFTMPASGYSLMAKFCTKEEEDKRLGILPAIDMVSGTLTYGLYPQTRVSNSTTIESLNALKSAESNGWYLLNEEYYAQISAKPYQSGYTFDDGTTITSGTKYWFKCEPITWKILSSSNGEYSLVSTLLLDAHRYAAEEYSKKKDGFYANSYENSEIRTWLNNDFYKTAFSLGDSLIETTLVDNSASTTDSSSNPYTYGSSNTDDEVYLLSYQDCINTDYGFSTDVDRQCQLTEWAKANGGFASANFGIYWTRSPAASLYGSVWVWTVGEDGSTSSAFNIPDSYGSVRPAITIKTS